MLPLKVGQAFLDDVVYFGIWNKKSLKAYKKSSLSSLPLPQVFYKKISHHDLLQASPNVPLHVREDTCLLLTGWRNVLLKSLNP